MSDAITKTWNGGRDTPATPGNFVTGDFFDVNNWHYADGGAGTPPQFAPGDTGVINSGTAIVTGATVEGINVILQTADRSPDSASPATLKLRDAVLDTGTTVDQPGASSFGVIEAQGIAVNQGAIVLDGPFGPGELRIQLDRSSLFANTGTIVTAHPPYRIADWRHGKSSLTRSRASRFTTMHESRNPSRPLQG